MNHDDEPCRQISEIPSVRVTGRVTRSMVAKANVVKPSVKDSKDIETIVLDDEEYGPVPHDCPNVDPEPVTHPVECNPHIPDMDPEMDSMLDPQIKGRPVEGSPTGSYRFNEAVHPLFVNHLLDKIHRMEIEMKEGVALNDSMKAKNMKLQENSDSTDKCILRLKRHKNMLIRKV